MNISYAPYLPADEEGSATIDNYIRMLDKRYSLEPLIRALEISERNSMSYEELPSGIVRQISVCFSTPPPPFITPSISFESSTHLQEVVILSDDEDEQPVKSQIPKIKCEPLDSDMRYHQSSFSMTKSSDLIDLTDDLLEDTDVPRHYISWLADLVARAKIKPVTVDQRLEVAVISQDIIVIDDDDTNKPSGGHVDSHAAISDGMSKVVTHADSPSSDSGCVIMNREDVGIIHTNSNFDISRCSSDTGVDDEEVALNESVARLSGDAGGSVAPSSQIHETNVAVVENEAPQAATASHHASAGSNSSSCSEPAAEQLLTVSVSVSKYGSEANVKNVDSVPPASPSRTVPNADAAATKMESTQASAAAMSPPKSGATSSPNISRTKQMQSDYVSHGETEIRRDASIGSARIDDHLDDGDSFLMDVFSAKPIRPPQTKHRVSFTPSTKASSTSSSSSSDSSSNGPKIVHSSRPSPYGTDWNFSREDCVGDLQDMSALPRRIPVSLPLSTIKASSLLRRFNDDSDATAADDNGYGNDDEDTDDESNELNVSRTRKFSNDRYISPYAKRTAILKASPLTQTHERSVRFADDVIAKDDEDDEEAYPPRRIRPAIGKFDVPTVQDVPSTIQERKSYLKPAALRATAQSPATIKSSPISKPRNYTPTPLSRLNVIPTARSPPPMASSSYQSAHSPSSGHDVPATPYSSSASPQPPPTTLPYRVFYSGTELDLVGNIEEVESSPLSDTCAPSKDIELTLTNLSATSTASAPVAFCESDNNLMSKASTSKATTQLPAAIVHPLGVGPSQLSKQQPPLAAPVEQSDTPHAGNADESTELENMLQIFKQLRDRLEVMGYKPEEDGSAPTSGGTKRLPSKMLETDELYGESKSLRESSDEIDEGDASLPFKKRRKLPVYSDTMELIKEEEDSDSQPAFESESPLSIPPVENEVEITSTSIPSPPLNNSTRVNIIAAQPIQQPPQMNANTNTSIGYPQTPMLSIANIVEYLPVRAYSTFKTPAPEIAPVRFNIVPQPTMVINNTPNSNVMGQSTATPNNDSARATAAPAVNIIPPQPQMAANTNSSIGNQSAQTANTACAHVGADTEQPYLASPMQTIASDGSANGFNVAQNAAIQYHRQTFHSNQPYTTTYSIQPTHQNTNNIPSNFDIQNMFNLHNYQMNPQNYHNLMQNSRINLQEKQAILLNDFVHSFDNNSPYENTSHQQQHQHQMQMHHMQQAAMAQSTNDGHKNTACGLSNTNAGNRTCPTSAPRTKAARKMVSETSAQSANVTSSSLVDKPTASTTATTKTNRVTRSSNRTTRAAQSTPTTEQKSPRRKTNRYK